MPEIALWRRLDYPGHEIAILDSVPDGWVLTGTAVFLYEDAPCKLDYAVRCHRNWFTQSVHLRGIIGGRQVDVSASADAERRWVLNGMEVPAVSGCIDIDFGFSPSTNLIPVRRLALAIGEEAAVKAAWMQFPSLQLEPLDQLYRRESQNMYLYESGGGSFVRRLELTAAGFVKNYPDFWRAESLGTS